MIQSVERALRLLNLVAAHAEGVGVRELARLASLKVTTAQNLLKTLANMGYLDLDSVTKRYRVGMAAFLLGQHFEPGRQSAVFARPYLEELHASVGESVVAAILYRERVLLADWIQATQPIAAVHFETFIEHPHLLAAGKVLLAYAPEDVQERYAASQPLAELQPNSPATPAALLAELTRTRKRGYGEIVNPCNNGVAAVAVPVFGLDGRPILALACSGPMNRLAKARRTDLRQALLGMAKRMQRVLSGETTDARTGPKRSTL